MFKPILLEVLLKSTAAKVSVLYRYDVEGDY